MTERAMTESTGKMRDWIVALTEHDFNWKRVQGLDILDGIEREIAERYIELPVDADGVPWHIGDTVEGHGMVRSLDLNRYGWAFFGVENAIDPALHRHAKPRIVEDVLADFAAEVEQGRNTFETARKYADELRELMGVDE